MKKKYSNDITFEIYSQLGNIAEHADGWTKELNLISWNDENARFDIRDWSPDHERMGRGLKFTEAEMDDLCTAYMDWKNQGGSLSESVSRRPAASIDQGNVEVVVHNVIGKIRMCNPSGWYMKLTVASWNGGQARFDVRGWSPDYSRMTRGIRLREEEMQKLCDLYIDYRNTEASTLKKAV